MTTREVYLAVTDDGWAYFAICADGQKPEAWHSSGECYSPLFTGLERAINSMRGKGITVYVPYGDYSFLNWPSLYDDVGELAQLIDEKDCTLTLTGNTQSKIIELQRKYFYPRQHDDRLTNPD